MLAYIFMCSSFNNQNVTQASTDENDEKYSCELIIWTTKLQITKLLWPSNTGHYPDAAP